MSRRYNLCTVNFVLAQATKLSKKYKSNINMKIDLKILKLGFKPVYEFQRNATDASQHVVKLRNLMPTDSGPRWRISYII